MPKQISQRACAAAGASTAGLARALAASNQQPDNAGSLRVVATVRWRNMRVCEVLHCVQERARAYGYAIPPALVVCAALRERCSDCFIEASHAPRGLVMGSIGSTAQHSPCLGYPCAHRHTNFSCQESPVDRGARVFLVSYLGRPKLKKLSAGVNKHFSMRAVAHQPRSWRCVPAHFHGGVQ